MQEYGTDLYISGFGCTLTINIFKEIAQFKHKAQSKLVHKTRNRFVHKTYTP